MKASLKIFLENNTDITLKIELAQFRWFQCWNWHFLKFQNIRSLKLTGFDVLHDNNRIGLIDLFSKKNSLNFEKLINIDLTGCYVHGEVLYAIVMACPNLETMTLDHCKQILQGGRCLGM